MSRLYGFRAKSPAPGAVRSNEAYLGVADARELFQRFPVGSVVYFEYAGNLQHPTQIARLSNGIQRAALESGTVPVLISTDQEHGNVQRLGPPAVRFPGSMALGATRDAELARDLLEKEIKMLAPLFDPDRELEQLHFGGGTPTFLNYDETVRLMGIIEENFDISDQCEMSIEIDPRKASDETLRLLVNTGFNRFSFGVQDFDEKVQQAVNRVQSYELVRDRLQTAREMGVISVNMDLIYGLPLQTVKSFEATLDKVIELKLYEQTRAYAYRDELTGIHNYRAPKPVARAKPAAPRRRPTSAAAREEALAKEFDAAVGGMDPAKAVPYSMDGSFAAKKLLQHSKFGLGLVRRVIRPNKIDVLFRDGARTLRTAG